MALPAYRSLQSQKIVDAYWQGADDGARGMYAHDNPYAPSAQHDAWERGRRQHFQNLRDEYLDLAHLLDVGNGAPGGIYALTADRRPGMSGGAMVGVVAGVGAALGALAWWLWPSASPVVTTASPQKTAGGLGNVVKSLGLYDHVLSDDDIVKLGNSGTTTFKPDSDFAQDPGQLPVAPADEVVRVIGQDKYRRAIVAGYFFMPNAA